MHYKHVTKSKDGKSKVLAFITAVEHTHRAYLSEENRI